ncbi:MAG: 50S ribosomal protein L10 [Candidatus Omnitrophica bacterium]|nr:50S ribosomal protein L10 [Candidatus Omnitrophota bacterium]
MAKVGRMVKESSVAEVAARLSERPNFFVTSLTRLPASDADLFRRKLSTSQAKLVMVKRRLSHRALEPLKISGLSELLEGSVGVILAGEDFLQVAKVLIDFHKGREEQLIVRGAVIDGQLLDKSRVQELASLPSKPILLAHVVATLEAPIADVIFTIEQLIGELAWVTEQAAAKQPTQTQEEGTPS